LANHEDEDSDSEVDEDKVVDELDEILQQDSNSSAEKLARDLEETALQEVGIAIRKSKWVNAGVKRYDEAFNWNLMNLSINTALRLWGSGSESVQRRAEAIVPGKEGSGTSQVGISQPQAEEADCESSHVSKRKV
jgi:hypothetical protein